MGVTQKEIAEKLNLSQSHVARALRNDPMVSLRTRERVQALAGEMGYEAESNREARRLASRRFGQKIRTGIIGIVFPSEAAQPRFIPFYRMILDAMQQEADLIDMDVCVCPCRGASLPRLVRDRNVDGVITMNFRHDLLAEVQALEIPLVTFHVKYQHSSSVMSDDYDGGCQATRHLLELGHRDIAFMSVAPMPEQAPYLRLKGFYDTMREYGVPVREELVENTLPLPQTTDEVLCAGCGQCAVCRGWEVLQARLGGMKEREQLPFTALICHNDPIAMSMAARARVEGYTVPEDLSIVGFDNVSRLYHFEPQLTSVDLGRAELGRQAIRLLTKVIAAAEESENAIEHVICPETLIVHASTRAPAILASA